MTAMDRIGIAVPADEAEPVRKVRLLLLNPNTTPASTEMMLRVARDAAGPEAELEGLTAPFGPPLITNEEELSVAAEAVMAAVSDLSDNEPDGIIIAAFGDPALEEARSSVRCEVVGIAEASMEEAAKDGRLFSVATTTPDLVAAIRRCAERYGHGDRLISIRVTGGDPHLTMANARELTEALEATVHQAMDEDGAEAIIIGGGPLADAARSLSGHIRVPLIEPIPAAMRLLETRRRKTP